MVIVDNKFRSRKLIVALGLEATATGLLTFGFIDQNIWRDVTLMVGAAYLSTQAAVDYGAARFVDTTQKPTEN